MVESHPSVAVLLYHRQRQAVILVRQFRPAVYVSAMRAAQAAGQTKPALSGAREAAGGRRGPAWGCGAVGMGCGPACRRAAGSGGPGWPAATPATPSKRLLASLTLAFLPCFPPPRAFLPAAGFTYELCAGIIDKPGLDLKQITREEVRAALRCAALHCWLCVAASVADVGVWVCGCVGV